MKSMFVSARVIYLFISLSFYVNSSFSQSPCNCVIVNTKDVAASGYISVAKGFSQVGGPGFNPMFAIHDNELVGGRFIVMGTGPNDGMVGIGVKDQMPLAKLHVATGTTILGGNTLISSDPALQKKWTTVPDNSTGGAWGLWLDKGVVATDYAITTPGSWADFVFDSTYRLRPLKEVETFIRKNKHLPGIPSAQKISEGYTVHAMNTNFIQKIEELTLYTIEQDKQIQTLQQRLEELAVQLNELKNKKGK